MVGKTMQYGVYTYYIFLWLISQGLLSSGDHGRQATCLQTKVPVSKDVWEVLGSTGWAVHSYAIHRPNFKSRFYSPVKN